MNDVFRAIYAQLASRQGPNDAFTLVGGRIYRTRAPEAYANTYPRITVNHVGGGLKRLFGGDAIEGGRFQITVWDNFRDDDASDVDEVYEAVVRDLEHETLTCLEDGSHLIVRREGLPREIADDSVISKSGDWLVERLMHR